MEVTFNNLLLFLVGISVTIPLVKGQTCYLLYHHCTGYDWCCPDGYVCTGSSTCLSIGAIVGACIGGLVGLGILIFCFYLCCRSNTRATGTVITNPGGTTTVVGQQQQSGQQYGYGQQPGQPYPGQQYPGQQYPGQPYASGQTDAAYPPKY